MESVALRTEAKIRLFPYGIIPFSVFAALVMAFTLFNLWLFSHNFASNTLLLLGEKVKLVFQGDPPLLVNLGFDIPPLPSYLTVIFRNPFLTAALVGGLGVFMLLFKIYQGFTNKLISPWLLVILALYVLVSPPALFLFTQQLPACLLIMLLTQCFHHLYRYEQHRISFDIFMFGMLSTLLFFTEFQTIFLIPFLVAAITAQVAFQGDERLAAAVPFVGLFPVIFFALSWCYMNWLFLGDPFHFIHYWRSVLEPAVPTVAGLAASHDYLFALRKTGAICFANFFLLLPYFVILFRLFVPKPSRCAVSLAVAATPLFLLFIQVITQHTEIKSYFFLIFLTTAVTIWLNNPRETRGKWFNWIFTLSFAVSLFVSILYPQPDYTTREEAMFARVLTGKHAFGTLSRYKDILKALDARGKILMDDTRNYQVVYLASHPERFILPYQGEYELVLAAPYLFARYIIVSRHDIMDRVRGRFPLAPYGVVPHYSLKGTFGNLYLYEVDNSALLRVRAP